ncbi:ABC transporter substrate-binding protein [Parafrankia sp. EUN1f]|uniref:ABC transporter substrate-binding protein n=1 Tax=Parafrankia sp. EUN1f TaxID=102897 RepID=UPI0001C45ABF|nr:ABC transporter substrate-binding protein [Parafrankia sp. EUN1f]EFC81962.1 ABC-type branched-chain amino acid transport systems periplasmic component-like protein [Parafrankia sp. EUN1f]
MSNTERIAADSSFSAPTGTRSEGRGRRRITLRSAGICVTVTVLAISACSTKGQSTTTGDTSGSAKIGAGIKGDTITLGVLTDATGVFAALGKELTAGQQIFWDERNAEGGVCGTYKVKLDVKDHGYNVQNATSLYSGMRGDVLGIQQLLGSAMTAALSKRIEQDSIVTIPLTWAASLTDNPDMALLGPTYDVEVVNGLDYLLEEKKIASGDAIGVIYLEGDWGATTLAGASFFAKKHNMRVVEQKVTPSDQDMTAQITALRAEGVKTVLLATSPGQTASAATVAATQGLNVPLVGNNPTFSPGLLNTPAKDALIANYYNISPYPAYDQAVTQEPLTAYQKKFPGSAPSVTMLSGFASAHVMSEILEEACRKGDLTREGVVQAKQSLASIDTGGLLGKLDYSKPGVSPSRENYVLRAASTSGGLTTVRALYSGPTAKEYSRSGS